MTNNAKQQGGREKDGGWLVLTESTGKEGKGYIHNCGQTVMGARVAHPIWDGPFTMSGGGQCQYETIPYCPKCETKPSFHGSPIDLREALWGNLKKG